MVSALDMSGSNFTLDWTTKIISFYLSIYFKLLKIKIIYSIIL